MNNLFEDFYKSHKVNVKPYINYAESLDDIYNLILKDRNINLRLMNYTLVKRETEKGFKLGFHRDNYLSRKFNKVWKFVPYNKESESLPKYSLIHYLNDEFEGASFVIYPNEIIKPKKNMFIFIDSNQIHKVTEQTSGIRITHLMKFY